MAAYRNEARGSWYVSFRYMDADGVRRRKKKEGFPTRREALAWEKQFLSENDRASGCLCSECPIRGRCKKA